VLFQQVREAVQLIDQLLLQLWIDAGLRRRLSMPNKISPKVPK